MIDEKKEELIRTLRYYFLGIVDIKIVKNVMNCLFVDIVLEEMGENRGMFNIRKDRTNFDEFLKELVE